VRVRAPSMTDHVGATAQVGDAAAVGGEHIDHAPRRAHDHLWAALELGDLLLHVGSAEDDAHLVGVR
jgi:hypothetical protein